MIDARQMELLRQLVKKDEALRAEGRPTDFSLIQMPGPHFGLKPDIDGEEEIAPQEGDFRDLERDGFVHLLEATSSSVVVHFTLTASGRATGTEPAVTADIQRPPLSTPPPTADAVLEWLHGLSVSPQGAAILRSGGAILNEAMSSFGDEHVEAVARAMFDLRDGGLVLLDDSAAEIDQISDLDQLGMAENIRLAPAGLAHIGNLQASSSTRITQIVHATQAQVAGGDIHNYGSFDELLDRLVDALAGLEDIDDEARAEARGILDQLRSASGKVAVGAAASSGGAVVGALLKQLLGLP
jgi:hypothetical protein